MRSVLLPVEQAVRWAEQRTLPWQGGWGRRRAGYFREQGSPQTHQNPVTRHGRTRRPQGQRALQAGGEPPPPAVDGKRKGHHGQQLQLEPRGLRSRTQETATRLMASCLVQWGTIQALQPRILTQVAAGRQRKVDPRDSEPCNTTASARCRAETKGPRRWKTQLESEHVGVLNGGTESCAFAAFEIAASTDKHHDKRETHTHTTLAQEGVQHNQFIRSETTYHATELT